MATEYTTTLPHCDWTLIYDHGRSPAGAKTLDLSVPSTPAGGVEISNTSGSGGVFKAVTNGYKGQIGINAGEDLYAHFTSQNPPTGSINITHYVH